MTQEIKWPDVPNCHVEAMCDVVWRAPVGDVPFRTCSWCGSIHPADLTKILEGGKATLEQADWKYGWPHKFYVNGAPSTCAVKWYNRHLLDDGYSQDARDMLIKLLSFSGVGFQVRDDGTLGYRMVSVNRGPG